MPKYFGKRQKNGTFAAVFVPNWTMKVRITRTCRGQLEHRALTNLEYYNNNQ